MAEGQELPGTESTSKRSSEGLPFNKAEERGEARRACGLKRRLGYRVSLDRENGEGKDDCVTTDQLYLQT